MEFEEDEDLPLSSRDEVLLGRALRNDIETASCGEVIDLTLGDDSIFTPNPDADMFTMSSPTKDSKRPRLGVGGAQRAVYFSGPSHVRTPDAALETLPSIDTDNIPMPDLSQLPQSQPTEERYFRKSSSSLAPKINLETGDHPFSHTSLPSPHYESNLPLDSPPILLSPAVPDAVDNDADNDFSPDYFWNFCSDDEECESCPMDASNFLGTVESPELSEEESSNEEHQTTQDSRSENAKDVPLYREAPINQWESLTSILSFVQSEHISGAGLRRLLSLIDLHLPKPNNFLKTNASLFKVLEGLEEPVHIYFFCSVCYKSRKSATDLCDTCNHEDKRVLFFITFPLLSQLQKMFNRPDFVENLKYKDKRTKKNVSNIEDIYDGEVYKEAERRFLEFCINITLMWNTDGMQVFNSNTYSLWPFYLVINELEPKKRFLSENLLIAGLWGSVVKPHPNVYLLPIYKNLKTLQEGVEMTCYGEEETRKVVATVICGTCDAPARACFMNMKQHSGFYSCPVCLAKGEKPGDATVFPCEEDMVLRNLPQYEEHVKWAVEKKVILTKTPKHEEKWCGIKGPTVLSHIVPIFFSSMATDSMHCVYLGVMRQMLHLWTDKEHKEQPFSIFKKIKIVNARISKLTPPHFLQRLPQLIEKLIYWKATELRSFLFNLSLIVLDDILLPEYYNHLSLFVKGVALLNSSSISEEDLVLSSLLLNQFVSQFSVLYGVQNMSHNVHMLLHLERCVRLLGPLWAISCFKFEDINGRISNFIHGTRHILFQIHSNISIIRNLALMVHNLKEGPAKEFCVNITKKRYRLKIRQQISIGVYCVGVFRLLRGEDSWVHSVLTRQGVLSQPSVIHLFFRVLKERMLYVSKPYKRGERVSSYVKYMKGNSVFYGNIECFVRVTCKCCDVCTCKIQYLAVIKPKPAVVIEIQGVELSHLFKHICNNGCRCRDENTCDVVNVSSLITVMFKIVVPLGIYLSEPLNEFELD